MLEDLIVAAVNDAGHKADDAIQASVQGMLGRTQAAGVWLMRWAIARGAMLPGV